MVAKQEIFATINPIATWAALTPCFSGTVGTLKLKGLVREPATLDQILHGPIARGVDAR